MISQKCLRKIIHDLMLLDFMKRVDTMFRNSVLDKVKRIQELRRSNAAQPVRNKKKYTRKIKHKNKMDQ
jgi:hypothetical protein